MDTIQLIEQVISSGVLTKALTHVSSSGASPEKLELASKTLARPLSKSHRALLQRWDGINLDVVRIYGLEPSVRGVKNLLDNQSFAPEHGAIVFADDPAGFIYTEREAGEILLVDSRSRETKKVAASMDEFFQYFLFGRGAAEFLGVEWEKDLRRAGVLRG